MSDNDPPSIPRRKAKDDDPRMIGSWKIGRVIGKGSSGRVRIARHSRTGQYAAVKIVSKTSILESRMSLENLENDAERILLAIEREIVIMKLIDHPNILRLYDVWETSNELYLILEYVEGGELFEYLCDKGKMSTSEALDYFQQVISAVDYCHRFNIAHRDLKPENLLLDKDKRIKVADFGMAAWQSSGAQGLLQTACGSPHYAAPEVIMGKSYNGFASDIWSCGVILYALLAGRLPFDDDDLGTLLAKVKIGKFTMPGSFDPLAKDVISRMLEKDPAKRITMAQILEHPFYKLVEPRATRFDIQSIEHMSSPIGNADDVDPDILANLRTLWNDIPEDEIIRHLTSQDATWEKGVYHLLIQYRAKHLEDYDPEDEDSSSPKPRSKGKTTSATPRKSALPRTRSRPMNLGQGNPLKMVSEANPDQSDSPEIVLHSPTPSPSGPFLGANMSGSSDASKESYLNVSERAEASTVKPPGASDEKMQDFFRQIVNHLNEMDLASQERSSNSSLAAQACLSSMGPTIRPIPARPPLVPPPTPISSRFVENGLVCHEDPTYVDGSSAEILIPDGVHQIARFNGVKEQSTPKKVRHRPPPLILTPSAEEDENYVLITPEDVQFPRFPPTTTPLLKSLLTPVSMDGSGRSPLSDRHVQIIEPVVNRPSKLKKRRSAGLSPGLSPVSPAFSDDSYFPPTPSSFSPTRRWFGHIFKFKPANYRLLSMADVYNTREECRKLLMGMGIQVTHFRAADGLDVLKCRLEETRDPAGMIEGPRAVQFRVEVRKPSDAQAVAGFTISLNLIQEKGALSSFRMMYNRLRREWDLDAPRPSLPLSLPSSGFSPGVGYAEAVYNM